NTLPVDSPPVRKCSPGELVRLEVASSHYSTRKYDKVSLHWALGGIDSRGSLHQDLAHGRVSVPFPHRKVAPAHQIQLRLPDETMLCTLWLSARTAEGAIVAQNF